MERVRTTIIVSTYNRPASLRHAVQSAIDQQDTDWQLLVIGDCCGPETGDTLAQINDPRVNYVNLPERCGEQSGPNSVGLLLTQTPYVAFLNHDDVWFPDHLQTGLQCLDANDADFFMGRAAFAAPTQLEPDRLVFTEASPVAPRYADGFCLKPFYFEPCSAWILRTEAAHSVGAWNASTDLYRTPLEDWVFRAWRRGLKLVSTDAVTVIKPRVLQNTPAGQFGYNQTLEDYGYWAKGTRKDPEGLRRLIADDLVRARAAGIERSFEWEANSKTGLAAQLAAGLNRKTAWLYRLTGYDWFDRIHQRRGLDRGRALRKALKRRTGETLQPRPDLNLLLADAREQLRIAR